MINSRKSIRSIGMLVILAMVFTTFSIPNQTFAAAKPKVKTITITNAKSAQKVVKKGSKTKLKVTVSPSKASKKMSYKSSNKKIATVSKTGIVKAKKKGTVYITVTAKDKSKKKKKIKVIVGTPVTKVTMTGDNDNTAINKTVLKNKTVQLKATVSPSNATHKSLVWTSSNPKVATVNSKGKVTYKKDGVVTITAMSRDGNKKKATYKMTVTSLKKNEATYIAHRGFSSVAPENSLAAYRLACSNGFQGVECDLWEVEKDIEDEVTEGAISPSGVGTPDVGAPDPEPETDFVLMHDSTLDKMTKETGSITNKTFEELINILLDSGNGINTYSGETIPSIEEYLNIISKSSGTQAIIEIKSSGTDGAPLITTEGAVKLVNMIEKYKLANRTSIISFGKKALTRVQDVNPNLHTMLLFKPSEDSVGENIEWAKKNKIDGLSMNYTTTTNMMVNTVKGAGLETGVYTVNNLVSAYEYVRLYDVDYITSNYKYF